MHGNVFDSEIPSPIFWRNIWSLQSELRKKKWKESMHFKRSYGVITDNGSAAIVYNNRYVDRKWHSIL